MKSKTPIPQMTDSELLVELFKDINNGAVAEELKKRPLQKAFNLQYFMMNYEVEDYTPPAQMTDSELQKALHPLSTAHKEEYRRRFNSGVFY